MNIYDPPEAPLRIGSTELYSEVTPFSLLTGLNCSDIEGAQTGSKTLVEFNGAHVAMASML